MQRRQLLKIILPLGLITVGVVSGVSMLKKSACRVLDLPALLKRLQPFSDAELGKKISLPVNADDLKRFDGLCEESFDEGYRQLVTKDFAERKTKMVDGWILSETEVLTHRAVYSHQAYLSGAPQAAGSAP